MVDHYPFHMQSTLQTQCCPTADCSKSFPLRFIPTRNVFRAARKPCLGHSSSALSANAAQRNGSTASLRTYSSLRSATAVCQAAALQGPDALLFDCDGVLVDTEADGHRVAFNKAFKQKGLDIEWDIDLYGRLLEIGGGKERMAAYFSEIEGQEPFSSIQGAEREALIKELHRIKTDIFMEMIESGALPLRPGVKRLVMEAMAGGVPVAVCSTSNERSVSAVVNVLLGPELGEKIRIYAGDVVPKKKPDPAIYLLAAKELSVEPSRCIVIEDSRIGLLAAKAAGMRCIVTTSRYTSGESFESADAIYDCIGDAGEERFSLTDLAPAAASEETVNA